ncbi:MAG: hypothetical protein Gaeavirus3_24 [Gaeavirus sp.]|uniref:S1-like domain-containing protein n=1 Tax=Gaeavirus sp. TaxID=2487767 RepID=A0A3G4ZYN1_9VIRU|nr:MAG: hypothetical protein Gaeavirus3_24 [Gaeavirus sp.]
MVKNIKGGNKTKKQKRGYTKKEVLERLEPGQMFGQVIENHGDHFSILCSDNVTRLGRLYGPAKRGPRITPTTFVVISLRDYETDQKKCDIVGIANPPSDNRNIFKSINPVKANDNDITFYNPDDDVFKEFDTAPQAQALNPNPNPNPETKDNDNDNDNALDGTNDKNTYTDPNSKYEDINWDNI